MREGDVTDAITKMLRPGADGSMLARPPRSRLRIWLSFWLLIAYVGIILIATISPTPLDSGYRGAIDKVLSVLHRNGLPESFGYSEVEFLANVAMFIPLGFLLGLLLAGRAVWIAIVLIPGFSAAIEFTQSTFLAARFATAQDVFANSLGGFFGLLVAVILVAIVHARDRKVIARALWDMRNRSTH